MVIKAFVSIALLVSLGALFLAYSGASSEAMPIYANESPSDSIMESQIRVYTDKAIVDQANLQWATYTNTESMKPVLDEGANGLEIAPASENQIKVGDIVSYQAFWNENLVVHRVVDIGEDAFGTYYILKGDNNEEADEGKIRFSQIKYKTVAIIY